MQGWNYIIALNVKGETRAHKQHDSDTMIHS